MQNVTRSPASLHRNSSYRILTKSRKDFHLDIIWVNIWIYIYINVKTYTENSININVCYLFFSNCFLEQQLWCGHWLKNKFWNIRLNCKPFSMIMNFASEYVYLFDSFKTLTGLCLEIKKNNMTTVLWFADMRWATKYHLASMWVQKLSFTTAANSNSKIYTFSCQKTPFHKSTVSQE